MSRTYSIVVRTISKRQNLISVLISPSFIFATEHTKCCVVLEKLSWLTAHENRTNVAEKKETTEYTRSI